jgi:hypothetical protein
MGRVVETLGGVLILGLLAGIATEATIANGHVGSISNDALLRPVSHMHVIPTATPIPSPAPIVSASVTPIVAPKITATTNAFVHLRASNSTASSIVADLSGGSIVQILPISDAQWQQVSFNGQTGYIFKTYLVY